MSRTEEVLKMINPPLDMSTFEEVEALLADQHCYTLCLRSTFDFVEGAIKKMVEENIPGDIVLAGVWRGGLGAYVQCLLKELGQTHRKLYLADTFAGFLSVGDEHPKDKKMLEYFSTLTAPFVSAKDVTALFKKLDLPMENVIYLEGDILKTTENFSDSLAILLVDLDFYSPTYNCLNNLYKCVSSHGYVYVDDYSVEQYECKKAVDFFIAQNDPLVKIAEVNKFAVYWRKK